MFLQPDALVLGGEGGLERNNLKIIWGGCWKCKFLGPIPSSLPKSIPLGIDFMGCSSLGIGIFTTSLIPLENSFLLHYKITTLFIVRYLNPCGAQDSAF